MRAQARGRLLPEDLDIRTDFIVCALSLLLLLDLYVVGENKSS